MTLEGKVGLVTGGGRGIGRAISLALAADGADVAVNYRKDAEAARETVEAITAYGRRAKAYQASIDSLEDDQALVESVIEDFGRLDILVNNAGIASRGHSVKNTDPAELERVIRTHALGPHHLTQAAIPHLRRHERSDVIFISSVATLSHAANGGPYNMGKAAMDALALTLAAEERRNGMRVNIVAPGLVDTSMGQKLMKAVAGVDDLQSLDPSMPFGRVCRPEDVAGVVRFLVSDAGGYLTGQRINVDGDAHRSR